MALINGTRLPNELLIDVFERLPTKDLSSCVRCCRSWGLLATPVLYAEVSLSWERKVETSVSRFIRVKSNLHHVTTLRLLMRASLPDNLTLDQLSGKSNGADTTLDGLVRILPLMTRLTKFSLSSEEGTDTRKFAKWPAYIIRDIVEALLDTVIHLELDSSGADDRRDDSAPFVEGMHDVCRALNPVLRRLHILRLRLSHVCQKILQPLHRSSHTLGEEPEETFPLRHATIFSDPCVTTLQRQPGLLRSFAMSSPGQSRSTFYDSTRFPHLQSFYIIEGDCENRYHVDSHWTTWNIADFASNTIFFVPYRSVDPYRNVSIPELYCVRDVHGADHILGWDKLKSSIAQGPLARTSALVMGLSGPLYSNLDLGHGLQISLLGGAMDPETAKSQYDSRLWLFVLEVKTNQQVMAVTFRSGILDVASCPCCYSNAR